jgi:hypothetical protein
MHYGSGSGSLTRFGSGSKIKWRKKFKKSNMRACFLGNNTASHIEKARFCPKIFVC